MFDADVTCEWTLSLRNVQFDKKLSLQIQHVIRRKRNKFYLRRTVTVKNLLEINIHGKKTIVEEIKAESEKNDYNVWKQVLKDTG